MLIRQGFVTNSSSSAYIMWGVEVNDEQVKEILGSYWARMTQQEREEFWSDYQGESDTDLSDWNAIYCYLSGDFGLGEFSYGLFSKSKLDISEVDREEGRSILYIKGSWKSVDRGYIYTLDQFKEHAEWLPEITEELQKFGINDKPKWFIVGAE